MDPEIQARIDQLYRDLKPLQEYYGIRSRTIQQRYEDYLREQAVLNNATKPRFKLPKL